MHLDSEKYNQLSQAITLGIASLKLKYDQEVAAQIESWIDQIDALFAQYGRGMLGNRATKYRKQLRKIK